MVETDETPPEDEIFIGLMTANQRDLRAFILSLVPHQVDADDLLQEVNLALWRKREAYDFKQNFLRWAFGFAALEVRSFRSRSARSRIWFSDLTIELLAEEWPRTATFVDDCQLELAHCIKKLGTAEREVVEAKYGNHQTAKEIAERTGKPLSTIYKTLTRALESLRLCVKRTQSQSDH